MFKKLLKIAALLLVTDLSGPLYAQIDYGSLLGVQQGVGRASNTPQGPGT